MANESKYKCRETKDAKKRRVIIKHSPTRYNLDSLYLPLYEWSEKFLQHVELNGKKPSERFKV